jgi:hypothetical protein
VAKTVFGGDAAVFAGDATVVSDLFGGEDADIEVRLKFILACIRPSPHKHDYMRTHMHKDGHTNTYICTHIQQ